ncbi:MAG: hypothetical protein M5U34_33775 [Chloroflexi bacterium]|nr:hypothetical protein [Chloroflexota bacterium]
MLDGLRDGLPDLFAAAQARGVTTHSTPTGIRASNGKLEASYHTVMLLPNAVEAKNWPVVTRSTIH